MFRLLETTASYVPGKNTLVYDFLDYYNKPVDNTTASFVIGFYKNQLVLARNLRRGIEIAGGHIEPGETVEQAGIREIKEETGAIVKKVRPFVRSTLVCDFEKPEHYKYPFPVSHMEFMIADIERMTDDIMTSEVGEPILIPVEMFDDTVVKDLSKLSSEDQLEFLDKMKNEAFRIKIELAIRAHFDYLEEQRIRKLTKFMLLTVDTVEVISEKILEAGGEFLYHQIPGNYYVAGFEDEDIGRAFQKKFNDYAAEKMKCLIIEK